MIIPRVKNFNEIIEFDYPVCEIGNCINESERLAMTETRMIDFCMKHYKKYILGE